MLAFVLVVEHRIAGHGSLDLDIGIVAFLVDIVADVIVLNLEP